MNILKNLKIKNKLILSYSFVFVVQFMIMTIFMGIFINKLIFNL